MNKSNLKVMIDSRLKKNIESLMIYENGCCSVKFKDIEDTFWFDKVEDLQEFMLIQAKERYYDKSLRKGYFRYINENNEEVIYKINNVSRGKLEVEEGVR
ncbi:hypothetical protein [Clostridium rectalis]|uniref:hypothetical protein n=1 Tax=Clostridium rectalis TaxID=2040295 RepID=UPI000F638F6F|nr:hypothetical protein [Clostridium rectalis]